MTLLKDEGPSSMTLVGNGRLYGGSRMEVFIRPNIKCYVGLFPIRLILPQERQNIALTFITDRFVLQELSLLQANKSCVSSLSHFTQTHLFNSAVKSNRAKHEFIFIFSQTQQQFKLNSTSVLDPGCEHGIVRHCTRSKLCTGTLMFGL